MKKRWIWLFLFVSFFLGNTRVEAATLNRGALWCTNNVTGAYAGLAYSNTSCDAGEHNVYYKQIGDDDAYCPQGKKSSPNNGVTVKAVSYGEFTTNDASNKEEVTVKWTQKKALVVGRIIHIIKSKNYSAKDEYLYISAALNKYLKFPGYVSTFTGDVVTDAVDRAKKVTFYTGGALVGTPITVSFASNVLEKMPAGYYKGQLNVTLKNEYPTGNANIKNINYTVSSCDSCSVYTDAALTQAFTGKEVAPGETVNLTLYVKSTAAQGSVISVGFTGSITIKYTIGKLWQYNKNYQTLITATSKEFTSSSSAYTTALVPVDPVVPETPETPETPDTPVTPTPVTKYVYFSKISSIGSLLSGADVKVELPELSKSCNTSNKNGCNLTFTDDVSAVKYKITELKAPSGYIISSPIEDTWTIGVNSSTCYRIANNVDSASWEKLASTADCNAKYSYKEVCLDTGGNVIADINSSEDCLALNNTTEEDDSVTEGESGSEDYSINAVDDSSESTDTDSGDDQEEAGDQDSSGSEQDKPVEVVAEWSKKCYNSSGTIVDDSLCNYDYVQVTGNGYNLYLTMTNALNSISFSKRNNNDVDLDGARLKVCAKEEYDKNKLSCTPYTTVNGTELDWYSSAAAITFSGFAVGTYYLIEEEAPYGYVLNTTPVIFAIDEEGKVTLESKDSGEIDENGVVVIKDEITKISISKVDIATTEELPGAKITICEAILDPDNEGEYKIPDGSVDDCGGIALADGTLAEWISTDKPHEIIGLAAGSYYLVEKQAPDGYSTAEAVLFILNEDGTLVDKDGNSLKDNKLVMYDEKIEEVKTGSLSFYIICSIFIIEIGAGLGSCYYMNKTGNDMKFLFRRRGISKES